MTASKIVAAAASGAGGGSYDIEGLTIPGGEVGGFIATNDNPWSSATDVFFKSDGLTFYVLSTSYDAVFQYSTSEAFNIDNNKVTYVSELDVNANSNTPEGMFFKPDGTRLYIIDDNDQQIHEYTLSTAWSLSTATFTRSQNVETGTVYNAIFFKSDGTKLYLVNASGDDSVDEYDMTTAWDITTIGSGPNRSHNIQSYSVNGNSLFFKPDGTKFYVGCINTRKIYQYTMSTAWTVNTANSTPVEFNAKADGEYTASLYGMWMKSDGTEFFTCGGAHVHKLEMSTAWDISTSGYIEPSSDFFDSENATLTEDDREDIFFNPDGTKMYFVVRNQDYLAQYTLSTAWDISTAGSLVVSATTGESNPFCAAFNGDGTAIFVYGTGNRNITKYTCGSAYDITTLTNPTLVYAASTKFLPYSMQFNSDGTEVFFMSFGGGFWKVGLDTAYDFSSANESLPAFAVVEAPTLEAVQFKTDGTIMYVLSRNTDTIYQYTLSTAWDVSTATYASKSLSVQSRETAPRGFYLKSDGSKLWVTGNSGDDLEQFSLSTDWDVSTGTWSSNYGNMEGNFPQGLFISSDGAHMYTCDSQSGLVYEYSMSTAWNPGNRNYERSLSVSAEAGPPADVFFKSDGSKMYIVGNARKVTQYALTTNWNISTATSEEEFELLGYQYGATGLSFKSDGTKMFISDITENKIVEYDLSTAWDVSTASFDGGDAFLNLTSDLGYAPRSARISSDGKKVIAATHRNELASYDLSTDYDLSSATFDKKAFIGGAAQIHAINLKDDEYLYTVCEPSKNVYRWSF